MHESGEESLENNVSEQVDRIQHGGRSYGQMKTV